MTGSIKVNPVAIVTGAAGFIPPLRKETEGYEHVWSDIMAVGRTCDGGREA